MLAAVVLPPFLVHRMAPAEYSAWVLILQLSAYINFLDLGLQTAIGKYIAEFNALGDRDASSRILSSAFLILCIAALLGAVVLTMMCWRVPQLFHQMPIDLVREVRIGLLVVGLSVTFALPFGTFLAAFTGLQEYAFPTVLSTISKLSTSAALIVTLLLHGGLIRLTITLAFFNVATAIAQYIGWNRYAQHRVDFSRAFFDRVASIKIARYASVLSIWTMAGLFVSGLDTLIVGHYDYQNTGFYAVASTCTNFMLLVTGNLFAPMLPAVSSLQNSHSPGQIGEITIKTTRYCALLLCLIGLPMFFASYPLLTLWVGHTYAGRSVIFLEVLILGNMVRQLGLPYSLVVIATGNQHLATFASVAEAVVNFSLSIWLVQSMGAVGVAIGTLAGAFVSVGVHVLVSMRFTRSAIQIPRRRYLLEGLLVPLLCAVPSVLLFPFWRRSIMLPAAPGLILVWALLTLGVAWFAGLRSKEHEEIWRVVSRLFRLRQGNPG